MHISMGGSLLQSRLRPTREFILNVEPIAGCCMFPVLVKWCGPKARDGRGFTSHGAVRCRTAHRGANIAGRLRYRGGADPVATSQTRLRVQRVGDRLPVFHMPD